MFEHRQQTINTYLPISSRIKKHILLFDYTWLNVCALSNKMGEDDAVSPRNDYKRNSNTFLCNKWIQSLVDEALSVTCVFCTPQCGDDSELYRQRLMEQIQLRKEILEQKERRRRTQAMKKKRRLKKRHRRDSNRCKKNNQHQQKPTLCSVLNCHSECQPVPQEHQYHHLVTTPHAYSGRVKEMPFNCPHQMGTDRVVFPGHRNLHCSTALASQAWEVRKRKLEMGDSDTSVPIKIRVVKHFKTSVSTVLLQKHEL